MEPGSESATAGNSRIDRIAAPAFVVFVALLALLVLIIVLVWESVRPQGYW
jgi:hypothetical protein